MIKKVKRWLFPVVQSEDGAALLAVLAMFAVSSLLIVPSISYVATNLEAGEIVEEKLKGMLAADAGIEDALWEIANDTPTSFPHSYQLTDVNGMTVDIVIDEIDSISGEEVGDTGHHEDWLETAKSVTYDEGIYSYTINMTNNGSGNIKIVKILIDFPPEVEYVTGSTAGDITTDEPTINGSPNTGITLIWEMSPPLPTIAPEATKDHFFQLSGPPDIEGIEGHGFMEAQRDDIGTVWDSDSRPFTITAQAKNASATVIATIRVGVWTGSELSISCWQIDPS